jgi:RNA recognition motif-containing protein
MFVGGLPYDLSKRDFTEYFAKFGELEDSIIMLNKSTGTPRGFGFVTYASESSVDSVLAAYDSHQIMGKWVEVKIATPKECM